MLVVARSMQAYFREAIEDALKQSPITVTEPAQVYMVHLLNEFSRSEKAFAGVDHGEKPIMVDMLERAYGAESHEALRIFRHLGDTSLYLLGFFKESQKNRLVSESYYKDMGSNAYSCASDLARLYAAQNAAIFQELAENFGEMVIILEFVASYSKKKIGDN